ncbi:MAG: hypothetical protein HYZ28_01380 [Myxococcales bacterium]|nr:hypothetical protein [Myxococcales bacterium]
MAPGDKLSRFKNLELPRQGSAAEKGAGSRARFGALEVGNSAPAGVDSSAKHVERFKELLERPLELDTERGQRQPFVRCCRCEADSALHAQRCAQCGEDLTTEEQRAFNEKLWSERQQQGERERGELSKLEAERSSAAAEEAKLRRAQFEAMARQVGAKTRARLDAEDRHYDWHLGRVRFGRGPKDLVTALLAASLIGSLVLATSGKRGLIGAALLFIAAGVMAAVRLFSKK